MDISDDARRLLRDVPAFPIRDTAHLNQDHQLHILRLVAARLGLDRADQVLRQHLVDAHYYPGPR